MAQLTMMARMDMNNTEVKKVMHFFTDNFFGNKFSLDHQSVSIVRDNNVRELITGNKGDRFVHVVIYSSR